jgi:hypothetical protein
LFDIGAEEIATELAEITEKGYLKIEPFFS